jgi:hypothetical protein
LPAREWWGQEVSVGKIVLKELWLGAVDPT